MLTSAKLNSRYTNILFWIIALFIVRLYGIWFPPLEVEHNWRQTTVTMVARNFLEVDANIFYPRVDMAGELTGITGMEFPILNYLIFLIAKVFGYQHWYGRLIVLIVSSFGILYFHKLIKKQFDERIAFNASFLLLFSLWFAYSRKIMPDTFACSFIIISIYHAFEYFENKKWTDLLLYFSFALIGTLAKLPMIYLLVYLAIPFFNGKLFTLTKFYFILASALLLAPVIWWYFIWTPYLTDHFGFWHFFMGTSFSDGFADSIKDYDAVLARLFHTPLKISGLLLVISSLAYFTYKKNWKVIGLYALGFVVFVGLVVLKSGWTFHHHNYYILGFIPVFVLPIAFFLNTFSPKINYIILGIVAIEGFSSQIHEFKVKKDHAALLHLETDLNKHFNKEDLIIFNAGNYPTPMYCSHHKGWNTNNEEILMANKIDFLNSKGAKGIVILKKVFGNEIDLVYPLLLENEDYKIYRIEPLCLSRKK